jgi:membrane fusion protein (multidrug efflux system)
MAARPKKDPDTGEALKNADGEIVYENAPVIGSLKFSDVTVEQSTGVVTIRAIFPNPEGILLPGMYVRAILEEGVSEKAILIPQKTVIRNNRGLPVVQVLSPDNSDPPRDGVYLPETRILTIDRSIGNQWLVTDGLKEGERIVLEGLIKIQGGKPVKAVPGDDALPGPGERDASPAGSGAGATAVNGEKGE